MQNRQQIFNRELNFIKDQRLRALAIKLLAVVPDYFFHVPASSTGKYHPSYALGDGGLVRHTQAAMIIANEILGLEQSQFSDREGDLMLIAIMFHDAWKHGEEQEKYTVFNHPDVAAKKIQEELYEEELEVHEKELIFGCIISHMGQWNESRYHADKNLPKPKESWEKFVHMCDYLASRKFIEIKFN